jgi:hypothetical protein
MDQKRPAPSAKWLTFQAAAKYVGVSVRTLQNWEKAESFRTANVIVPGSTRGRRLIDRESLDEFIEGFVGAPKAVLAVNAGREATR